MRDTPSYGAIRSGMFPGLNSATVFFLSLLLLALPGGVHAQFDYVNMDVEITITGYTGEGGEVSVPDTIEGRPVTQIAAEAFYGNATITSIIIPDTVLGIGARVFDFCPGLAGIIVDGANSAYSSADGVLFNSDRTTLIRFPEGKSGDYVVPASVATIVSEAFMNCAGLTSVTIPDSVTSLGSYTFSYCGGLTSAVVGNGVINIGIYTFNYCSRLASVTIGNATTTIGEGAFTSCSSLLSMTIPDSVTSIGASAFNYCSGLTNVTIGAEVTSIGDWAFGSCSSLTGIEIPNKVNSLGKNSFSFCSELLTITIPDSVIWIGDFAFASCSSLTNVYFRGDAPGAGGLSVFSNSDSVVVYYPGGATGWGPAWSGTATQLWDPRMPTSDPGFGVTAGEFGFVITGSGGEGVVVEACEDLANPDWLNLETVTLTGGSAYFSDSGWQNFTGRFYRLRMP